MKKILLLVFVLVSFIGKSQQRFPTGFPTQLNTGWNRWGYAMSDSGLIVANRDTNWLAKFSGTIVFKPSNKEFYWFDSTTLTWKRFGYLDTTSLSNRINLKLNISDTTGKWLEQSTRLVDTMYRVNDSTIGYTIKGNVYTFQILGRSSGGGGGSGVTSVGLSMPSAFSVSGSPVTSSGTLAVSGAGTTLQYMRGNGTLATTDTTMVPNFYLKVRGLLSGTSPITFNTTTGAIGITNANTSGTKGAATFSSSSFSDNGLGLISLVDVVSAGSCNNCNVVFDSKGRATSFSNGSGGVVIDTADNGLTKVQDTIRLGDVSGPGAPLKHNTFIDNNGFKFQLEDRTTGATLQIDPANGAYQIGKNVTNGAYLGLDTILHQFTLQSGNAAYINMDASINHFKVVMQSGFPFLDLDADNGTHKIGDVSSFGSGNNTYLNVDDANSQFIFSTGGVTKALLDANGQWKWPGYPALTAQIDTTTYKPIAIDGSGNVVKMAGWAGSGGGGTGGGIAYIYSSTAPTGNDTSKLWVKTPAIAGVYDVYTHISNAQPLWQRFGWLTIDGFFSTLSPINLAGAGQSNMGGVYPGGDTSWVNGIVAYTSGSANSGIDNPTHWETARIGKSPFYLDNNNMAYQFAKNLRIKEGRIVRIVMTYQGGVGLSAWLCGSPHYLLDTLRNRLSRSGIDTLQAFLWHHGEAGGCTGNLSGGYYKDMADFYDTLCVNTNGFFRNVTQFIAGELGGLDAANRNTEWPFTSANGAIRKMNEDGNLNTASVPSYSLSRCDDTHFCGTALDTMGLRMYGAYKEMPHTVAYETRQLRGNFDTTYEQLKYDESNFLEPASGSGFLYKYYTTSFAWRVGGINTLAINNDGTVGVSNADAIPGVNTSAGLKVNSRMSLADGTNSIIAINFNPNATGGLQRNVIFTNYSSNWNLNPESDNVFMGYNAGATASRMSLNSVMIGSDAGNGLTPAGSGDYNIGIGKGVFTSSAVAAWTIAIGHLNGAGMYGGGNTLIGHEVSCPANISNASVYGYTAVADSSNQVVLGNSDITQLKVGDNIRFKVSATPNNGDTWVYDNSTQEFKPQALSSVTTIYNGNGTLSGNRTVTGGSNSLTFNGISNFKVNANVLAIDKSTATAPYSFGVIGASNQLWVGYTPTAAVYSKGAAMIIDTNNNVSLGDAIIPTTAPLYSAGGSVYADALQLEASIFQKVQSVTSDITATLYQYYFRIDATSGNITITLPAASTAFGNSIGIKYVFKRIDNSANTVTIQRAGTPGTDTIDGAASFVLNTQYEVKRLQCSSASTWDIE